MTDNGSVPAEARSTEATRSRRGLFGTAVELALASIGVVGLVGDEAQALYRRSIERGRDDVRRMQALLRRERLDGLSRKVRRRRANDSPSSRREQNGEYGAGPLPAPDEWRLLLARLNLPTETDVRVLTEQVAELEAQIERLLASSR